MTIVTESVLVESRSARESQMANVTHEKAEDAMSKAKALIHFAVHQGNKIATTEQVAEFYEVPVDTVRSVYTRHKPEFIEDGLKVLKGKALRDALCAMKLPSDTSQATAWNPRGTLRLGMLLRDSEVAKAVRTSLLDGVESTSSKVELELIQAKNRSTELEIELAKTQIKLMQAQKAYQESSYWLVKTEGAQMLEYLRGNQPLALPPSPEPETVFVNDRGEVVGSSKSKCGVTKLLKDAGYSDKESRSTNLQKHAKQVLASIGINYDTGEGLETATYIRTHKVCPEERIRDAIAALVQDKAKNPSIWSTGLDLGI